MIYTFVDDSLADILSDLRMCQGSEEYFASESYAMCCWFRITAAL